MEGARPFDTAPAVVEDLVQPLRTAQVAGRGSAHLRAYSVCTESAGACRTFVLYAFVDRPVDSGPAGTQTAV